MSTLSGDDDGGRDEVSYLRMTVGRWAFQLAPGLLPLNRVAGYHGTTKARIVELGRDYLQIYERYLRGWRRRRFALLEIGVYRGESLRTWKTYFRNARIYGLDIDPAAAERAGDDFRIFIGSQADVGVLSAALAEIGESLLLLIDDGSHINELTVASFDYIFPRLPRGALYAIEDLAPASYVGASESWPGMTENRGVSFDNRREDIDDLIRDLCQDADGHGSRRWGRGRIVSFVHVWPGLLIVERA